MAATIYFAVPWSNKHYGPDGPWQAVTVSVGGNDSTRVINQQASVVDLMPGGEFTSWILTPDACRAFPGQASCGKGGTWQPADNLTTNVQWKPHWVDPAWGLDAPSTTQKIQGMTINERTVWNVSLIALTDVTITNPDGHKFGPELGTLGLGARYQMQIFSQNDANGTIGPGIEAWMYPGALFNQSFISSYSFGLHIGSAALNYPGSLVFGGYDKGRLVGPFTSFEDSATLLDIGIGVETGGSPFDFTGTGGLLLSNTSQAMSMQVVPDPLAPYLHLPGNTCQAIARLLPVTYDIELQYYLWNTDDPMYQAIVTSASYLNFSFPPAPGATGDVVIKVPFALLNLTLDAPIVSSPTPYFPCRSFTPLAGDNYRLGRAFLQAAFYGRNWRTSTSWLAQAVGPGVSRNGLGVQNQDIHDDDTTLSTYLDSSLFAQSWKDHWRPLAAVSTTSNATSLTPASTASATATASSDKGLSSGAKVGIGIGAAALVFIIVGTAMLSFCRRRRKSGHAQEEDSRSSGVQQPSPVTESKVVPSTSEAGSTGAEYELPGSEPYHQ